MASSSMDAVSSLPPPGTSRCSARIRWLTRSRRSLAATLCGSLDTRTLRRLGRAASASTLTSWRITAAEYDISRVGVAGAGGSTGVWTEVGIVVRYNGFDGTGAGGCCGGDADGDVDGEGRSVSALSSCEMMCMSCSWFIISIAMSKSMEKDGPRAANSNGLHLYGGASCVETLSSGMRALSSSFTCL